MAIYHVSFIRQLSEDIPVLQEKGLPVTSRSMTTQLAEEFEPFMKDGIELRMGSFLEKDDNGDNYRLEGFVNFPQEEVLHSADDAWEKRLEHLKEFLSFMQQAYDEGGAAGLFEVVSVQHGRSSFPASEIVAKARAELLVKGKDLLSLSAEEIFDRTKRQEGDIVLITSGEFENDGIHSNTTAYAVGRLTMDGLFEPIRSHLRMGEAKTLFNETVAADRSTSLHRRLSIIARPPQWRG
jgi:hypothetical protein